jgi:3-methyladenine DNA glycosylase AlkC
MQRLRRTSECLHATLPADYKKAIAILRKLAPRINSGFVTLVLPDYVGLYGRDDFDTSLEALKFLPPSAARSSPSASSSARTRRARWP